MRLPHEMGLILLLLLPLLFLFLLLPSTAAYPFRDVSLKAGLRREHGPRLKYGGPTIVDVDADGYPDLVFGHHGYHLHVYLNARNGTFHFLPPPLWRDIHAITPFRPHPSVRRPLLAVSVGGRSATIPNHPLLLSLSSSRTRFNDVSKSFNVSDNALQRGRSAVILSLRPNRPNAVDLIFTGAPLRYDGRLRQHNVFAASPNLLQRRPLKGPLANTLCHHITTIDVDNDRRPEVLCIQSMRVFKLHHLRSYHLYEITHRVFPSSVARYGGNAVVEFDYDNDGLLDLYVARSFVEDNAWIRLNPSFRDTLSTHDLLLRNVAGRYVDVTKQAGLSSMWGQSRGVTAGDFDNDGWMDLLVVQHDTNDVIWLNNRDGTFRKRVAAWTHEKPTVGDGVVAVDYDRDGRLDLVMSEGAWHDEKHKGYYRLLRNVQPHPKKNPKLANNFLLIRVRNSPKHTATSLHAFVVVYALGKRLVRKVGPNGVLVSNSYIELLHFGIGRSKKVSRVVVKWSDNARQERRNVRANALIAFGVH